MIGGHGRERAAASDTDQFSEPVGGAVNGGDDDMVVLFQADSEETD